MILFHLRFFSVSWLILAALSDRNHSYNFNFFQNDYQVKFEWTELVRYNKSLVNKYEMRIFKYNRTCTAVNTTFDYKVPVGRDLELVIQAYKFASNEYRLFPMRFQINYCFAMGKNLAGGGRALACGNFTGCPIRKNRRYHICNWVPDNSRLPPFIPAGRYKLEGQGLYHNDEAWLINVYGEVYRPFLGK